MAKYFGSGKSSRGKSQTIAKSTGMADGVARPSVGKTKMSGGKSAYGSTPKGYSK